MLSPYWLGGLFGGIPHVILRVFGEEPNFLKSGLVHGKANDGYETI
jgi:hypothetical protein